jgi:hypothetical protein
VNFKSSRDFSVNQNSPLLKSSNEEMVNMKVVELFKSYLFYLGFTFKNSKIRALFKNFGFKSNFPKYLPLVR